MIVDTSPGAVVIRDAGAILGICNDLTLTPAQALLVAARLDSGGQHTVAAEGLRRAAHQALAEQN